MAVAVAVAVAKHIRDVAGDSGCVQRQTDANSQRGRNTYLTSNAKLVAGDALACWHSVNCSVRIAREREQERDAEMDEEKDNDEALAG